MNNILSLSIKDTMPQFLKRFHRFLIILLLTLLTVSLFAIQQLMEESEEEEGEHAFVAKIVAPDSLISTTTQWNIYPLDSDYLLPEDLFSTITEKTEAYPHLADWYIIGESSNYHLPIYAFRLTNKSKNKPKPAILFHGQHHSEEVIGVEIVMHMSDYFLENYKKDDFITTLLDDYQLWFVPTANPEGFRVVNSGEHRMKRKNETDTNFNGVRELDKDGVDLNRNYDINWHEDTATNCESPYFKGYEPACQKEIKSMQRFYADRRFNLAFFYHSSAAGSYSERIFFPWRWNGTPSPDYEEMLHLAKTLASDLPRSYAKGKYQVHQLNTSKRGLARDYIYSNHNTLSMLIEVGGDSPFGEGVAHPPNEVLNTLKENHTKAMVKLLKEYHKNLTTIKIVDSRKRPVSGAKVIIDGKQSPHKRTPITDKNGYLFYYLLTQEEPFQISINREKFSFHKPKAGNQSIEFKTKSSPPTLPPIEIINNNEAIVMTSLEMQYFPLLSVKRHKGLEKGYATVSILNDYSLSYRQQVLINNSYIDIPWVPFDVVSRGVFTVQLRDIFPLADNLKIANKVAFLKNDEETLTYCLEKSDVNSFYLHPNTKIGIDYSLYPSGGNDYHIKEIRVNVNQYVGDSNLEISLYDGATPLKEDLVTYINKTEENPYLYAKISPNIKLPDNLYLIISNDSPYSFPIFVDKFNYVYSNRQHIYYSSWESLSGADLAVEVILIK